MGREVRRVPLDFDAPLRKTWQGFINPHPGFPPCADCTFDSPPTIMDRLFPMEPEVNAEQHQRPMDGHDAINRSYLIEFRCKQLGIPMECPTCRGHGDIATDDEREAVENWEGTDPPEGDGWQLWETVSEGSPISPVFPTAEALAVWMTRNDCTVNGPVSSYDAALKFVQAGWAPSFMSSPETGFVDGVTYVGREAGV